MVSAEGTRTGNGRWKLGKVTAPPGVGLCVGEGAVWGRGGWGVAAASPWLGGERGEVLTPPPPG